MSPHYPGVTHSLCHISIDSSTARSNVVQYYPTCLSCLKLLCIFSVAVAAIPNLRVTAEGHSSRLAKVYLLHFDRGNYESDRQNCKT